MRAQIINRFGEPGVFELVETPKPILQPGHVLVKVAATSINPIDVKVRSGLVKSLAPAFPAILHGDVAGVIEEVAADITDFKIGDEIYGCAGGFLTRPGALAEYMLVDPRFIAKKPKKLSMLEAAALPLVSITAWQALFSKAKLQNNQTILIHAGMGGVGHIAVQLAKWRGANVHATVRRDEDFSKVKNFGAETVINAQNEDVASYVARLTQNKGFEVVFDTVGGDNLDKSFLAAGFNGTVVTIAARSTHDLSPLHSKGLSLHCVFMLLPFLNNTVQCEFNKILTEIAALVDQEKLKPCIDPNTFTLETIRDAHSYFESGKARGKVVIKIN